MRPIELTLQGLHSFKNRQTVDFSKLLDAGVFGIFGPTGAGKSTILDAVTLALYGSVERAPNKTTGILNQSSESVEVSLIFELGQGIQRRRYKVERVYKRKAEFNLENKISRLSEISGTDDSAKVIADKQGDVNTHVAKIIGLSMEDFTRAVVLPQGKFAEFLKLVGAERNKMLQRLFNL